MPASAFARCASAGSLMNTNGMPKDVARMAVWAFGVDGESEMMPET